MKLRYVRVERAGTGSWMTYKLPYDVSFDSGEPEQLLAKLLPGWEFVSGCRVNPDTLCDDLEQQVELDKEEDLTFPLKDDDEPNAS